MVGSIASPCFTNNSHLRCFAMWMNRTLRIGIFLLMIILNIFLHLSLVMSKLFIRPFFSLFDIVLVACLLTIVLFLSPFFISRNDDQNHNQYQRYFHLIITLISNQPNLPSNYQKTNHSSIIFLVIFISTQLAFQLIT